MKTTKMNFDAQYIANNPESNEARLQERVVNRLIEATDIFEKLELYDEVQNIEEETCIFNWFIFGAELFDIEHLRNSKVVYADTSYGLFIAKTSNWDSFIEDLMNALYNTSI